MKIEWKNENYKKNKNSNFHFFSWLTLDSSSIKNRKKILRNEKLKFWSILCLTVKLGRNPENPAQNGNGGPYAVEFVCFG